jgi:hypothetical protein
MQLIAAIEPYDPELVKSLVGSRCAVSRLTNKTKVWWVTIQEVKFCTERSVAVKVAGHSQFGHARWVSIGDCRWKNHIDDYLLQQAARVKGLSKAASRRSQ